LTSPSNDNPYQKKIRKDYDRVPLTNTDTLRARERENYLKIEEQGNRGQEYKIQIFADFDKDEVI